MGRPLRAWLAGVVLRFSPHTTVESVRLKLVVAGLGRRMSPQSFLAAKAGLGIARAAGRARSRVGVRGRGRGPAPRGRARRLRLPASLTWHLACGRGHGANRCRRSFPSALDLLAVSVEAGLSFDSAVAKLTEQMEGPLVDEFELMLAEIRMGDSRENALKKLAERSGVPEVASFARAMIQADRLGVSIGRLLRSQATETRLKREAAAEERAMKAPIKMLFPTVLFIFPALFLVVLGPAFIQLFELF